MLVTKTKQIQHF